MIVRITMRKPTTTIELTNRDRRILDVLTVRVRLLSLSQIARSFWPEARAPIASARKRMTLLEQAGLVDRLTVLARPELALSAPIMKWAPGAQSPNFGSIAFQLQNRWKRPPAPTTVVVATARAGNWRGGEGGRRPRTSEATHDLHVAAVYLKLVAEQPGRAEFWISESTLARSMRGPGVRLPDAMIDDPSERTVIEFGGAYSKTKLADFHEFCRNAKLAYEIW